MRVEIPLGLFPYLGQIKVMAVLNPSRNITEKSYVDNVVLIDITIYQRYKMLVSPANVASTNESITFALSNVGSEAENASVYVYHYEPVSASYTLLQEVIFANLTSNECRIGNISGLFSFFSANATVTSQLVFIIPPYFSGTSSQASVMVPLTTSRTNPTPKCVEGGLNAVTAISVIEDHIVHVGTTLSIPLSVCTTIPAYLSFSFFFRFTFASIRFLVSSSIQAINAAKQFVLSYHAPNAPTFSRLTTLSDQTASFEISPGNDLAALFTSNTSQKSSELGTQHINITVGLLEDANLFSHTSFRITLIAPYVTAVSRIYSTGGRITIEGNNFGSNASNIKISATNVVGNEIICSDVTLLQADHQVECTLPAGGGYELPLTVYAGPSKNVDGNTYVFESVSSTFFIVIYFIVFYVCTYLSKLSYH